MKLANGVAAIFIVFPIVAEPCTSAVKKKYPEVAINIFCAISYTTVPPDVGTAAVPINMSVAS
jgi:hypothetical protein